MEKIYIINTNSAVFQDQFVRQINSAISVVYSELNRRYFLNVSKLLPAVNISLVINALKLI